MCRRGYRRGLTITGPPVRSPPWNRRPARTRPRSIPMPPAGARSSGRSWRWWWPGCRGRRSATASWGSAATATAAPSRASAPSSAGWSPPAAWPSWPFSCCARWPSGRRAASAAASPLRSGVHPPLYPGGGTPVASGGEGQAAEAFGVADAGGATAFLGPFPQELPEPLARLHQLALVAEQRVDLRLDVVADVDPAVGLQGAGEVDGRHVVDRQAGGQLLGEVVGVAGAGGHGVEGGPAGHAVVGVVEVAVAEEHRRGVGADHDLGLEPADQFGDPAADLEVVAQLAVAVVEVEVAGQAQHLGRLVGLGDAGGGQGVAVLVGVLRALLALGADEDPHRGPAPGPAGQRAAGRDLGIDGVAVDGQDAGRDLLDGAGAGRHRGHIRCPVPARRWAPGGNGRPFAAQAAEGAV